MKIWCTFEPPTLGLHSHVVSTSGALLLRKERFKELCAFGGFIGVADILVRGRYRCLICCVFAGVATDRIARVLDAEDYDTTLE